MVSRLASFDFIVRYESVIIFVDLKTVKLARDSLDLGSKVLGRGGRARRRQRFSIFSGRYWLIERNGRRREPCTLERSWLWALAALVDIEKRASLLLYRLGLICCAQHVVSHGTRRVAESTKRTSSVLFLSDHFQRLCQLASPVFDVRVHSWLVRCAAIASS